MTRSAAAADHGVTTSAVADGPHDGESLLLFRLFPFLPRAEHALQPLVRFTACQIRHRSIPPTPGPATADVVEVAPPTPGEDVTKDPAHPSMPTPKHSEVGLTTPTMAAQGKLAGTSAAHPAFVE